MLDKNIDTTFLLHWHSIGGIEYSYLISIVPFLGGGIRGALSLHDPLTEVVKCG